MDRSEDGLTGSSTVEPGYERTDTLLAGSPLTALQTQLPRATGEKQCFFLFPKSPTVLCSSNTTSPLFVCLLIPTIRAHGGVMTEMISPSPATSIAPYQLLHHQVSIHTWTRAAGLVSSEEKIITSFYLQQILPFPVTTPSSTLV